MDTIETNPRTEDQIRADIKLTEDQIDHLEANLLELEDELDLLYGIGEYDATCDIEADNE